MTASALAVQIVAYVCACWSFFIFLVQSIGISRIFQKYSSRPRPPVSSSLAEADVPHITIIRPVKGLEHQLYDCISSTFHLNYPIKKLTIHLCVADKSDPAYPILKKLVADFPQFDARVLVEEEDPLLHGQDGHVNNLGPNPKIRNISRGYREAKGDIIWMIDCNVWVGPGVAGRMVDKLLGLEPNGKAVTPFKFVHLLPLVVDTVSLSSPVKMGPEGESLLSSAPGASSDDAVQSRSESRLMQIWKHGGGLLDEMFMATTHAKFYGAINTVGIAPCVVGKSNMFRKPHLDEVTDPLKNPILQTDKRHPTGIDYFSSYICEDHLIGDLLWRSNLPGFKNHGLVYGDLAIQPMAGMPATAYIGRRVRWLRARKWTVITATMVEPGVESLLCCAYFSFALTTIPWFHETLGFAQTWTAMILYWLVSVIIWMVSDWYTYCQLQAGKSVEVDENTPKFARGTLSAGGATRRPFLEWLPAWVGRELLALPIWTWAVLLGSTVTWRGKTFTVRMDMSVIEIETGSHPTFKQNVRGARTPDSDNGRSRSKARID